MATPKPSIGTGDLCTFNVQHGFAEALLRGMRSSFLSDPDYHHLTQCETLDDVRLNLTETDYAEALADTSTLTPNILQKKAVEKVCHILLHHFLFVQSYPWLDLFCVLVRWFSTITTQTRVSVGSRIWQLVSSLFPPFYSSSQNSSTCAHRLWNLCPLSSTLSHMNT